MPQGFEVLQPAVGDLCARQAKPLQTRQIFEVLQPRIRHRRILQAQALESCNSLDVLQSGVGDVREGTRWDVWLSPDVVKVDIHHVVEVVAKRRTRQVRVLLAKLEAIIDCAPRARMASVASFCCLALWSMFPSQLKARLRRTTSPRRVPALN